MAWAIAGLVTWGGGWFAAWLLAHANRLYDKTLQLARDTNAQIEEFVS